MGAKALVTGAAGFIGSHVADHCLAMGMDVVATDDLSVGRRENVPSNAHWREGDLTDDAFVRSLWDDGPFDYVYHLGAYATQHLSHYARRHTYMTNVVGSMHLINEAVRHPAKSFVFASTVAVYGRAEGSMHEGMPFDPDEPYGVSKCCVEMDLKAARKKFGLNSVCFRPHNVYGERQNMSARDKNVVAVFVNQCLRGEPMSIWGDGSQVRMFSHVDDVAPVIARAPLVPQAENEAFNIGAETSYTILQLASEVAAACGVLPNIVHLPPRHEIHHAEVQNAKARRVFQTPPPIDLATGLRRMVAWARQRGPVKDAPPERVELTELRARHVKVGI